MPTLLEVQSMMRRSIVERDDAAIAAHVVAAGLAPARRLAIYRHTFDASATKALRLGFPAVDRLVGTEFFDGAANMFIHEAPPRTAYFDGYGADFPAFLEHLPPAAGVPYLGDVARLEWAVSRALHARDVPSLALRQLASLDDGAQDLVRFHAHPSVSLLQLDWPADAIWRAVLDDNEAELASLRPAPGAIFLIVSRLRGFTDVTRAPEGAFRFMSDLCSGLSLATAIAARSVVDPTTTLAEMLMKGLFSRFELTGSRRS